MALAKLAPFLSGLIGVLGPVVFQGAKNGLTMRENVVPINVKSSAQVAVRASMSVLSKAWSGLTESQRRAWDSAAAGGEWTQTSTFGDSFNLSGEQLYLKLNLVIVFLEETAINVPPTKAAFNAMSLGVLAAAAGTPALTVAYTGTVGADQQIMIFASPQVSQGVMSSKSVSFVHIASVSSSSPLNILAAYTALKGALVAGKKIFIRMEVGSILTGEKILIGESSVIIAA